MGPTTTARWWFRISDLRPRVLGWETPVLEGLNLEGTTLAALVPALVAEVPAGGAAPTWGVVNSLPSSKETVRWLVFLALVGGRMGLVGVSPGWTGEAG